MKIQHLLLLAYRYLRGTKEEKSISTMVKVCFLSIAISTFSLALVISIMRGFEKSTHDQLQGVNAQIILDAGSQEIDYPKIKNVLEKEFKNTVAAFAPSGTANVIIEQDDNQPCVALLKAIDPQQETLVTSLLKKIINPKNISPKNIIKKNKILVGHKFAEQNDLTCGDQIKLLFVPDDNQNLKKISLDCAYATIGGIFKTGIDEYDTSVIMCGLKFLKKLFPNSGITTIEMKLHNNIDEQKAIESLKKRFNLDVYSWQSLYPALVAALKLEKYAMFFILVLLTLVASMNIISLLFMLITNKKRDIAILCSMGLEKKYINLIFIFIGQTISCCAALCGLVVAFLSCILLKKYPFIKLPDIYYSTHLPVAIEWKLFLVVFFVVFVLGLLASAIATRQLKKINITNVLRFEQ